VAHACDPTTQEAEIRRTEVQSQPWQIICETLSQKYPTQKNRSGGVAQGVFKPQYCQREREREREREQVICMTYNSVFKEDIVRLWTETNEYPRAKIMDDSCYFRCQGV
jgi:hypothetical protein